MRQIRRVRHRKAYNVPTVVLILPYPQGTSLSGVDHHGVHRPHGGGVHSVFRPVEYAAPFRRWGVSDWNGFHNGGRDGLESEVEVSRVFRTVRVNGLDIHGRGGWRRSWGTTVIRHRLVAKARNGIRARNEYVLPPRPRRTVVVIMKAIMGVVNIDIF